MASTNVALAHYPEDDLSLRDLLDPEDAEIDALLDQAEKRMRAASKALEKSRKEEEPEYRTVFPKLEGPNKLQPYLQKGPNGIVSITDDGFKAQPNQKPALSILSTKRAKSTSLPFMRVEDPVKVAKEQKEKKTKTAGAEWYNMPLTSNDSATRRNLQMIKLRNVLDPHKHFKGDDWKSEKGGLPKYSQMGTVIEGATEFYSARIDRKERKKNMVAEVMGDKKGKERFKRKYEEIQRGKKSGGKEYYKKIKERRKKGKY